MTILAFTRVPVLRTAVGGDAEGSRGLRLVGELAARWGYQRVAAHEWVHAWLACR